MARVVLRPLAPDLAFCRGSTVPFRPTAVGVASFTLPQLVHSSRDCLVYTAPVGPVPLPVLLL